MVSSGNAEKRRAWQVRFARYRSSGLSVAQFCEQERVSPKAFYYWANQLKTSKTGVSSSLSAARNVDSNGQAATVRFRWTDGAEVLVPAECLGVIRCLVECIMSLGDCHGEGFQEVVVKA